MIIIYTHNYIYIHYVIHHPTQKLWSIFWSHLIPCVVRLGAVSSSHFWGNIHMWYPYHVYRQIESIFALIFAWCSEVYLGRVNSYFHSWIIRHIRLRRNINGSFSRCLEVIIKRREHRSHGLNGFANGFARFKRLTTRGCRIGRVRVRERGLRRWMLWMGSICQHWQWVECHIQWMLGVGG